MKSKATVLTVILAAGAFANNLNTGGLSGVNRTYSAYSIGQGSYELGLSIKGEYGNEALEEYELIGTSRQLKDVLLYGQDLYLVMGIANWMDIAVDLPFYEDVIDGYDEDAFGFGDFAASLKLMHPGMKPDALIRLAYIMRASFPTGGFARGYYARDPLFSHVSRVNGGGAYTSGGYNLNPMLAWTFDLTRLKVSKPWLVHLNFGMDALFYPTNKDNLPAENTGMQGGLAVEWLASPAWSMFLDFNGKSRLGNITDGPFLEIFAKDQLTLALGTKNRFKSGLSASLVVEAGVSTQENFTRWKTFSGSDAKYYGIQPTPNLGVTLTLGFGAVGKKADSDFDGNRNQSDSCPQDAEDYDGYEDGDGCPDPIHVASAPPAKDTVIVIQRDTVTVVKSDTVRVTVPDTLQYQAQQDPNRIFGFGKTTFPAINFKTGSDELEPTSFKTLNDIAQSMKNFPTVDLQVIGFTDNTGSAATNKALSEKRAASVVAYLVTQGIPATRLQAIGMGTENPVGSNKTGAGRLLNRRVEFKRVK